MDIGPASFNNFGGQFSAVYEPVTPVASMNAMLISSGLPSGWSLTSGAVNFGTDGIRNYLNFSPVNYVIGQIDTTTSRNCRIGTSGGSSSVYVIRVNDLNVSTSVNNSISGPTILDIVNPLSIYFMVSNRFFSCQRSSSTGIPFTILDGRPEFVCVIVSTTVASYTVTTYLNGVQVSKVTGLTALQYVDFNTNFTIRNPIRAFSNFDVIYHATYDIALTPNQVKLIHNSVAPLLDLGAPGPALAYGSTFSAFTVPSGPIVQFNANDYTLNNGAVWGASGWAATRTQQINMSVDGGGRKFLSFYKNGASISKNFTVNTLMDTNKGSTIAVLMRINSSSSEPVTNIPIVNVSGLNTFYLTYPYPLGSSSKLLAYDTNAFSPQRPDQCYSPPIDTFNSYLGRFCLFVYTWSNTTTSLYVNNVQVGQASLGTGVYTYGDQASFITAFQIGILNATVIGDNSVDVSYVGFWDRAITQTEMTNLYNSCSMLTDMDSTSLIQSS